MSLVDSYQENEGPEVRATKILRITNRLGKELSENYPEIADMYREGDTIPKIVDYCKNGDPILNKFPKVAKQSVRVGLARLIEPEELKQIGKSHMLRDAKQRGLKGVFERGDIPYHHNKKQTPEGEFYEDEYIIILREEQQLSWKEITQKTNQVFGSDRPERDIRLISQFYHRFKRRQN